MIAVSIVEDAEEVRERIQQIIRHSDEFVCLSAHANAEDALQQLPVLRPDIALMDINLPGMSGIECIRQIKNTVPAMQFMMFTIYEDNERVFEALAAGANGYLLKKTSPSEILDALKELYEGGSPMSSRIARKVVAYFQKRDAGNNDTQLSPRETEVLELLAKGFLYKEIGNKLGIATGTVRQHIHKIYDKLHVQNRTEALNRFYGRKG